MIAEEGQPRLNNKGIAAADSKVLMQYAGSEASKVEIAAIVSLGDAATSSFNGQCECRRRNADRHRIKTCRTDRWKN
jgi:hypothetical protein